MANFFCQLIPITSLNSCDNALRNERVCGEEGFLPRITAFLILTGSRIPKSYTPTMLQPYGQHRVLQIFCGRGTNSTYEDTQNMASFEQLNTRRKAFGVSPWLTLPHPIAWSNPTKNFGS